MCLSNVVFELSEVSLIKGRGILAVFFTKCQVKEQKFSFLIFSVVIFIPWNIKASNPGGEKSEHPGQKIYFQGSNAILFTCTYCIVKEDFPTDLKYKEKN